MNTRILFAAVVVSMFVVCQQVHAQENGEPVMPEATELEGTWEMVSWVADGEQVPTDVLVLEDGQEVPDVLLWRFQGNKIFWQVLGDTKWSEATFSVNPSARPAEIDLPSAMIDVSEDLCGIYEIDGDLLTVCYFCFLGEQKVRPRRFESSDNYPTELCVFRRVEEESE